MSRRRRRMMSTLSTMRGVRMMKVVMMWIMWKIRTVWMTRMMKMMRMTTMWVRRRMGDTYLRLRSGGKTNPVEARWAAVGGAPGEQITMMLLPLIFPPIF